MKRSTLLPKHSMNQIDLENPDALARACAIEAGLLFDRGNAPRTPRLQHALEQGGAIPEAPVEAALGDAEILGQHLHPYTFDAGSRDLLETGLDPGVAFAVGHIGLCLPDTVPYC